VPVSTVEVLMDLLEERRWRDEWRVFRGRFADRRGVAGEYRERAGAGCC
jgi:hypothetical protein